MALLTLQQRSPQHRAGQLVGWAIAIAVVISLPYHAGTIVRIDQYCEVAAFAVAILGLNLVIGYAGAISLGHSAFVGLGAYTTVILVADHGWSYFATLPVAFAICFAVGVVLGLPALRIRGFYIAVVTLSLATVFPTLVVRYASLTGGANGIVARDKLLPPDWTPWDRRDRFGPPTYRYFVIVTIAALMFVLARNLVRSRVGRALIALRDNQTIAATNGVNVAAYKVLAFGASAAFAGIAGSLLMIDRPVASQTRFDVTMAIFLVVGLVVGGVATISGAIPGAILYVFLPYYTTVWSTNVSFFEDRLGAPDGLLYGALLLAVVFVLPGGLVDGLRRVRRRVVRIVPNPSWRPRAENVEQERATEAGATPDDARHGRADTVPVRSQEA
jgi:branched-chain amino acid transport system permease protein